MQQHFCLHNRDSCKRSWPNLFRMKVSSILPNESLPPFMALPYRRKRWQTFSLLLPCTIIISCWPPVICRHNWISENLLKWIAHSCCAFCIGVRRLPLRVQPVHCISAVICNPCWLSLRFFRTPIAPRSSLKKSTAVPFLCTHWQISLILLRSMRIIK